MYVCLCTSYNIALCLRPPTAAYTFSLLKKPTSQGAFFDDPANSSGQLTNRLAVDATYIRGAVADSLGMVTQQLATLAAGYGIAFAYDWRMALLVTGGAQLVK